MKKILVTGIALLPVLCSAGVYAAEGVSGSVSVGGISADVNGDRAKFREYNDPDSGITGGVEMHYKVDPGFVDFSADDIDRDVQKYGFEAGQYGKFKVDAYYKEIPHNLTFDARSYYTGVGSDTLTTTATSADLPTNPALWPSDFDYSVTRDQYGAGLKLDLLKPFFADFSVSRNDQSGIKPAGGWIGVSTELPEPVDYQTDTFKTEIGYGQDPFFVSLSYMYSGFENENPYLYFTSLEPLNRNEFLSLPPDNNYSKLAFKGRVKLPMRSTFAVNIAKSEAESDMDLISDYNNEGTAFIHNLSDDNFDGEVDTFNYDVVLTSNPLDFLDAKLFYSEYDKDNESDEISSSTDDEPIPFTNHLFEYDKTSYGVEAGFKLPAHVALTPYYTNVEVDRARGDLPETEDDIYGLKVKWSGLDFMTVKSSYEWMDREAPWHQLTLVTADRGAPQTDQEKAELIEPNIRRFDAADQERDIFKFGVDLTPIEIWNIGLGYTYKKSDYPDTVFGMRERESNGVNLSSDLTLNDRVMLSGYLDYEVATIDQTQRNYGGTADGTGAEDTTDGDGRYNWTAEQEDETLDFGLAVDVDVMPKVLTLRAQYDHVRSDGFADYTYFESVPLSYTNSSVDSDNWDDYTKRSFLLKAIYDVNPHVTLTGGYAYEEYDFNDQFFDGYSYVWNSNAVTSNYLTGAGADPNYFANVFFLSGKYKF